MRAHVTERLISKGGNYTFRVGCSPTIARSFAKTVNLQDCLGSNNGRRVSRHRTGATAELVRTDRTSGPIDSNPALVHLRHRHIVSLTKLVMRR
jgi:hypothetical protein